MLCVRLDAPAPTPTADDVLAAVPDVPAEPRHDSPRRVRPFWDGRDDALRAIPATEYVPALSGWQVGRDGKMRCPFHGGGQERTPSLHAYDDADAGWYCYGCSAGGDVYVFATLLYGLDHRRDFLEIRRRLASDLLGAIGGVAA